MLTRKKTTYLTLLILILVGLTVGIYQVIKHREAVSTSTYAYVNLQELVVMNPKYATYYTKKIAFENLQAQYEAEQKMMALKEGNMEQALKSIHGNPGLAMATEAQFKANMAVKEAEANTKLIAAYDYYVRKFGDTVYTAPTPTDLRIVNLQLQLLGLKLSAVEKEAKEKELERLLSGRTPTLLANDAIMMEHVMKAMAPLQAEVNGELNQYASELGANLQGVMAEKLAFQESSIVDNADLPNPIVWQEKWHNRLQAESAQVNHLYSEMVEDIRQHIAQIAQEKGLTLVVDNPEAVINAQNITDDVIASFKK